MLFYVSVAFIYYRQLLDPTSSGRMAPSSAFRTAPAPAPEDAYPEHYAPPYLSYEAPQLGKYDAPQDGKFDAPQDGYAPPAGPPPVYGGARDAGYLDGKDDDKDDPFADFEAPGHQGKVGESREALV